MRHTISIMLASSALFGGVIASPACAADGAAAGSPPTTVQEASTADNDQAAIVVTARRKPELLEDVPQTVQAVTGNTLEQLNLLEFTDLSKVIAGITLDPTEDAITMRGVSFSVTSQTSPTASTYINEAPVAASLVFQSLFDVQQIEVLKGPQGTARGESAPTGAITLTTHRPDLENFGGYAMGTASDQDVRTLQGAINIPVIKDKFALRVAGITDHNNNGGIKSANSTSDPFSDTSAFRVSALAEPVDGLSINLTYEHLVENAQTFGDPVYGTGSPGTAVVSGYADPFVPVAGYNGPAIPIGRRLAVAEKPDVSRVSEQLVTAQVDYSTDQFKLSYIGSWEKVDTSNLHYGDTANQVPGDFIGRNINSKDTRWTHELRLSTMNRVAGIADVSVGVFHLKDDTDTTGLTAIASFFPGAFGSPAGAPVLQAPNMHYALPIGLVNIGNNDEWSFYGNATLHLDRNTELTGGIRVIHDSRYADQSTPAVTTAYGTASLPSFICPLAGGSYGATYPGVCDLTIPVPASDSPSAVDKHTVVYSATLSHHFSPALMTYFNFGTSWRPGAINGGLVNPQNDPVLDSLTVLKDETTQSYEIGVKASALDHRLNASVAFYHQLYQNFDLTQPSGINYLEYTSATTAPTLSAFYNMNSNVDANVDGIDLDFNYQVTPRWSVNGSLSWANARYKNQLVPCNGTIQTGQYIAECRTSGNAGTAADWNLSLRSDYSHPITPTLDGFVSGIFTYTPRNPNSDPLYTVPSYALINLNVGIRNRAKGWELQGFVKNLTNNGAILSKSYLDAGSSAAIPILGSSGYSNITYQNPREFGVSFRFTFGAK